MSESVRDCFCIFSSAILAFQTESVIPYIIRIEDSVTTTFIISIALSSPMLLMVLRDKAL